MVEMAQQDLEPKKAVWCQGPTPPGCLALHLGATAFHPANLHVVLSTPLCINNQYFLFLACREKSCSHWGYRKYFFVFNGSWSRLILDGLRGPPRSLPALFLYESPRQNLAFSRCLAWCLAGWHGAWAFMLRYAPGHMSRLVRFDIKCFTGHMGHRILASRAEVDLMRSSRPAQARIILG